MKDETMTDKEFRVIQFFLSPTNSPGPGIFEVSSSIGNSDLRCTCPGFQGRKGCKHITLVKGRMAGNDGVYPMEISTRATKEDAVAASDSPEAFREFVLKYGKIEVC